MGSYIIKTRKAAGTQEGSRHARKAAGTQGSYLWWGGGGVQKLCWSYFSYICIAVSYIIIIKEGSRHAGRQQARKEGSRQARQLFEFGKNLKNSDPTPLSQSESTFEMYTFFTLALTPPLFGLFPQLELPLKSRICFLCSLQNQGIQLQIFIHKEIVLRLHTSLEEVKIQRNLQSLDFQKALQAGRVFIFISYMTKYGSI